VPAQVCSWVTRLVQHLRHDTATNGTDEHAQSHVLTRGCMCRPAFVLRRPPGVVVQCRLPHVETRSQGWAGTVWYSARLLVRPARPTPIVDGFPTERLPSWQKRPAHANQQPGAHHQSFLALGSGNTERDDRGGAMEEVTSS
jgi:hypothetical protein